MFDKLSLKEVPPVNLILIAVSVLTFVAYKLGMHQQVLQAFLVTQYAFPKYVEISQGQVWRLVTPIFIHFSILHVLFNMLCMYGFATVIERRYGSLYFTIFVLVTAVLSNYAQYAIKGPSFGGMSGVVYAVFGYIWMQSKFNPWSNIVVHDQVIMFIMLWFVLCWTGLLGPIANYAHTAGLVAGLIWGYAHAVYVNNQRR